MDTTRDIPTMANKAKRNSGSHASSNSMSSAPTTFFIKSEKEMDKMVSRGRKISRASSHSTEDTMTLSKPTESITASSSFGVESLEDTINSANSSSESSLSRTNSNTIDATLEPSHSRSDSLLRKRRSGNPVHPKILAAGQRIISSEWAPSQSSYMDSPTSVRSSESPYRVRYLRRSSTTSSISLSQPNTPSKPSPTPDSVLPGIPRSGSMKSFRLSDEEEMVLDDTQTVNEPTQLSTISGSSAVPPQLVMPSLSMPRQRPYTDLGRGLGRLKIMVLGPKSAGKTSFINSMFRTCQHIVHVDESADPNSTQILYDGCDETPLDREHRFRRYLASTRPRTARRLNAKQDGDASSRSRTRASQTSDHNLTVIDTPALDNDSILQAVSDCLDRETALATNVVTFGEDDWYDLLSGGGGSQLDAVIYIFEPRSSEADISPSRGLSPAQADLLRKCATLSNLIPVVGKADVLSTPDLLARKRQILQMLQDLKIDRFTLMHASAESDPADVMSPANEELALNLIPTRKEPFAISSLLGDDTEIIDASVLMSSQYLPPLKSSDLPTLLENMFSPINIGRLKRRAASKVLKMRHETLQQHTSSNVNSSAQSLSPLILASVGDVSGNQNLTEDSKVLVPRGDSSFFRSISPSASEASIMTGSNAAHSIATVARSEDNTTSLEPFREIRLAKWTQDLQQSLYNEQQRYTKLLSQPRLSTIHIASPDAETDDNKALIPIGSTSPRPARGRLGGELAIIDPTDPLGLLALSNAISRRGFFALQIASSFGLLGAVTYWVVKNWADVQAMLGWETPCTVLVNAAPVPTGDGSEFMGVWGGRGR